MKEVIKVGSHCLSKLFKNCFSPRDMWALSRTSFDSGTTGESDLSNDHCERLRSAQRIIPKLAYNLYKGQCGRIGVIGGSFEYTGAPYFAAISALKMGADVVHVFCCREAGPVIKSYSPELIVHPILDREDVIEKIEPWLKKLHVLVIGPGMGRDKDILLNVAKIINYCKNNMESSLPLVIDADGLFLISEDINLIKGYQGLLILTPNVVEFNRLCDKMSENDPLKIAASLNAILLQKGRLDIISNGLHNKTCKLSNSERLIICDVPGSNRRCGGQGDVLSGCISTVVAWLQIYLNTHSGIDFYCNAEEQSMEVCKDILMLHNSVVYSACAVARTCSRLAFEHQGRGMTASDVISYINKAYTLNFTH